VDEQSSGHAAVCRRSLRESHPQHGSHGKRTSGHTAECRRIWSWRENLASGHATECRRGWNLDEQSPRHAAECRRYCGGMVERQEHRRTSAGGDACVWQHPHGLAVSRAPVCPCQYRRRGSGRPGVMGCRLGVGEQVATRGGDGWRAMRRGDGWARDAQAGWPDFVWPGSGVRQML
jgi:hypothetical protein